jgi:hypothetical protein
MQFLTKDPARADGEESAYQYCGGDPVGKVDPSGLYSIDTTWTNWRLLAVSTAVGGAANFEWRAKVVWKWVRPRISAKMYVEFRKGFVGGRNYVVDDSYVKAVGGVKKSASGSKYDTTYDGGAHWVEQTVGREDVIGRAV